MKRLLKFRHTSEAKVIDGENLTKEAKAGDFVVDEQGENLGDFTGCLDNATLKYSPEGDKLIITKLDKESEKEETITIVSKHQIKALKDFLAKIPT